MSTLRIIFTTVVVTITVNHLFKCAAFTLGRVHAEKKIKKKDNE